MSLNAGIKKGYLGAVLNEEYHIQTAEILFLPGNERVAALFNADQLARLRELGFDSKKLVRFLSTDPLTIALAEKQFSAEEFVTICEKGYLKWDKGSYALLVTSIGLRAYQQKLMSLEEAASLSAHIAQSLMEMEDSLDDLRRRQQLLANPESWRMRGAVSEEDFKKRFNSLPHVDATLVLDGLSLATAELISRRYHEPIGIPMFVEQNRDVFLRVVTPDFIEGLREIDFDSPFTVSMNRTLAALLLSDIINIKDLLAIKLSLHLRR